MLSSFVVVLVSSTFLVQNNYYAVQTQRTGAQDNVRVATELIAREVRRVMDAGIVVAGPRTLVIRSPIVLGVVCARPGAGDADIHTEAGPGGFDPTEVAGYAARNAFGLWEFGFAPWSALDGNDVDSADNCGGNGADTTGAVGEFHRLVGLDGLYPPVPAEGDLVMLFRESTFKIQPSQLDPSSLGLFRAAYGDSLVEFATGMDSTAQFQYRDRNTGVYVDTIGPNPGVIDAVRIVADARRPAQTGGREDVRFGWAVNIPIWNTR